MHRVRDRFLAIIKSPDIELSELQGSMLGLVWGLWLINPWYGHPDTYGDSPLHEVLLSVFPHWTWSILFLVLAIVQLYGLFTEKYRWRRVGCLSAVVLWGFVSMLLLMEDWHLLVTPTTCAFTVGAGWGYVRLKYMELGRQAFLEEVEQFRSELSKR